MPNAMVNGIATANVNGSSPSKYTYGGTPANQPYNTLVYDSQATADANAKSHQLFSGNPDPKEQFFASPSGYDQNGAQWYDNGAQGAGYYRSQTADELARSAQQYYTQQFRSNIPQIEQNMYTQMASGVNQSMNAGIKGVEQNNSRRGLLHGGINAGQEGAVRASAASAMASGRSSINSSVENAANNMDSMAINTGIAVQQQQQQMQNAIYSDAMAKMNAGNGAITGLLSAVGGVVAGIYTGGAGAGAGAAAGAAAGKAIS